MQTETKKREKVKKVNVSSFANNGRRVLKQNDPDKECFRELTGSHLQYSKVAIEYEKPMLHVSTYDHDSQQFLHCFSQDIVLDYEGFFVISASSGLNFPQYNFLNSFKVFDPTTVKSNNHFEDSHNMKAEHEHYAESMAATISDLIHIGAHDMGEDFEEMETEDMLMTIAEQNFYMQQTFEYTHALLYQMSNHFNTISDSMNEHELYDHQIKMNQDLFQIYFAMSKSLAGEINYLDQKDDEIEQIMQK